MPARDDDDLLTHEPPALSRVDAREQDREITLGTGTLLGIFFALALGAAVVFFMGYTLGRRSAQNSASVPANAPAATITVPNGAKPSANSAPEPAPAAPTDASTTPADVTPATPASSSPATPAPAPITAPHADVQPALANLANVVQVAAVSRQDDADVLISALRKKGYAVAARTVPGDNLIHIQVGPFQTRAEADQMRQRLLADGYNAIVK